MTDRPIIMSGPMVKALLDGRKTQTRRIAWRSLLDERMPDGKDVCVVRNPTLWQKLEPGDRIWVKETWKPHSIYANQKPSAVPRGSKVFYRADDSYAPSNTPWVPSIYCIRWASRLTLEVTATKMEPVQAISGHDARAEGHPVRPDLTSDQEVHDDAARDWYMDLWRSLHRKPGQTWDDNPEVVALTFEVHQRNIDQTEDAA